MNKPRILFVDDEPMILQSLRGLLWKQRNDWEMVFASGGEKALAEMANAPFDLIISDMNMPGMGGTELMTEVRGKYPSVMRVVLSGTTDRTSMLKIVPLAHQYLSKPFDGAVLHVAIERALSLRAGLDDESLRQIVGGIKKLPSIPRSYHQLNKALADPRCGMDRIAEIVKGDPALSIRILQLANSTCFGSESQVSSIPEAVRTLGASLLKGLALMGNILSSMESHPMEGLSVGQLQLNWIQSSELAKRFLSDSARGETAFTATLIRDIGKIIIALHLPEKHTEIMHEMARSGLRDFEVEKSVLGTTHAEIGAYLVGTWGLPFTIVESVAFHHVPRPAKQGSLEVTAATHVASAIVDAWDTPLPPADSAALVDTAFLESSGLAAELPRWLTIAEEHRTLTEK